MVNLATDPLTNVVWNGIKMPIRLLLEREYFPSALALTYSAIDTMAYLAMPDGQDDVTKSDFVSWCDSYVNLGGRHEVTGLELYAARCGVLHTHSPFSRLSRQGTVRLIAYVDDLEAPVTYAPDVDPSQVVVAVKALVEATFVGMDRFLVDAFANANKAPIVNARLDLLLHTFPYGGSNAGGA